MIVISWGKFSACLMVSLTSLALAGCLEGSGDAAAAAQPANAATAASQENREPTLTGTPAATVVAGSTYQFVPQASDPDANALTFSIQNAPNWVTFDTATGALAGTPSNADVGLASDIIIRVTDGILITSLPAFSIQVIAATSPPPPSTSNRAPVLAGVPGSTVIVGNAYTFQPNASDADGNALTFSIAGKPVWATFNTSTGSLTGVPTAAAIHPNIRISVSDGTATAALPAFSIAVQAVANRAPVIAGTPLTTVTAGTAYTFQPTASDADGNTLGFSITNRPAWATFSSTTGRLSGTPTAAATHAGIVIRVSDGTTTTSLPAFTVNVTAPANRAPTITGAPSLSATVGTAYNFQPTASDADGNTLGFSITNRPAWATFSTTTGQLSGTPTAAATHAGIVISASDGTASTSLPAFTLTVTAAAVANRAPVISGNPSTSVIVGSAYSFTPGASDADGDALTFSIANRPVWATFNAATGQLSGTPAAGNVGAFSGITITVSDGKTTTALAAFSITVTQVATGSVTLSWTAPTQNTDGSPLSNLTGYRIYYGTNSSSLTQSVDINNASVSTYVLGNLSPATWYFAVKAIANGAESNFSNVASKTIS